MINKLARTDQLTKHDDPDLIKAIAMDIGKQVAHHIETMYPEAVRAASSTFLLSVRNTTHNEIMAAIDSEIDAGKRLVFHDKFRRYIRAQYKKIRKEVSHD